MNRQPMTTDEDSKVTLKRDVGLLGSFAMGYADVGADIYIALGLVTAYAAGWAPIAFLIASITYIMTGLAYAELSTAYPYAGGAQVYTMKAINDFAGFMAGWLVMLDYTVCIALFAIATTGYLSFFMPTLSTIEMIVSVFGLVFTVNGLGLLSFVVVLLLIIINTVGIREPSALNVIMVVLNLVVLSTVLLLGLVLSFRIDLLFLQLDFRGAPLHFDHISYIWSQNIQDQNFLYAVTLAMSSFIGIESIAQAAEETKRPDRIIPRATKMAIAAVLVFAVGLATVSIGILDWAVLAQNTYSPLVVLASSILAVGTYIVPVVAFAGLAICLVSSNTGVIGVSRVVFSMSNFGLIPRWFSKIHPKARTPIRTIVVFGLIGAIMALIGNLDWVADLYNFGALLSYMLVNTSLLILRYTDRDTHRAWQIPLNVNMTFRGQRFPIPISAIIGVISCGSIWILVVLFHPMGRLLGMSWMTIGFVLYSVYRKSRHLPLFSRTIGSTIRPMAYKLDALVLIRPEEREDIVESIVNSLDNRFRLTLLTVVKVEGWSMTLQMLEQYRELARNDLETLARQLRRLGLETDIRVETGTLKSTLTEVASSSEYDFIILLSRKGVKKTKRDADEDIASIIASVAPGKLMIVRK